MPLLCPSHDLPLSTLTHLHSSFILIPSIYQPNISMITKRIRFTPCEIKAPNYDFTGMMAVYNRWTGLSGLDYWADRFSLETHIWRLYNKTCRDTAVESWLHIKSTLIVMHFYRARLSTTPTINRLYCACSYHSLEQGSSMTRTV